MEALLDALEYPEAVPASWFSGLGRLQTHIAFPSTSLPQGTTLDFVAQRIVGSIDFLRYYHTQRHDCDLRVGPWVGGVRLKTVTITVISPHDTKMIQGERYARVGDRLVWHLSSQTTTNVLAHCPAVSIRRCEVLLEFVQRFTAGRTGVIVTAYSHSAFMKTVYDVKRDLALLVQCMTEILSSPTHFVAEVDPTAEMTHRTVDHMELSLTALSPKDRQESMLGQELAGLPDFTSRERIDVTNARVSHSDISFFLPLTIGEHDDGEAGETQEPPAKRWSHDGAREESPLRTSQSVPLYRGLRGGPLQWESTVCPTERV